MTLDRSPGAIAIWRQVADVLREEIRAGQYRPGQLLPSEHQLAERFDISRPTVRQALATLRTEGLVGTEYGRGTYVLPKPVIKRTASRRHAEARATGKPLSESLVEPYGQTVTKTILNVGPTSVPPDIAPRLEIEEGTEVLARSRIIYADNDPIEYSVSYYPMDIATNTQLTVPEPIEKGVLAYMEQELGIRHVRAVEDLTARMPTAEERKYLNLDIHTPILRLIHTAYDTNDRPVEVVESAFAGNRFAFRDEFPLD